MSDIPQQHKCPICGNLHFTREEQTAYQRRMKTCVECDQVCGDAYLVTPEVWAETGLGYYGGLLHLKCLEKRIGRQLTLEDFGNYEINGALRFGMELARRASSASSAS